MIKFGYAFLALLAASAFLALLQNDPAEHSVNDPARFVVAPVLVGSTLLVFASGIELWLFGLRFGSAWIEAHAISAVVMIPAAAAHVLAHLRRSGDVMVDELSGRGRDAIPRRSVVLASVVAGSVLAVASLLYASPFTASVAGG